MCSPLGPELSCGPDPGFPVRGGANFRRWRFSAETCVKTKELGPIWGRPLDPPIELSMVIQE